MRFLSKLNSVLRYSTKREDFEKLIDKDPHDWQNHLVYSDWLRDNGEDQEADFRASMGKWLQGVVGGKGGRIDSGDSRYAFHVGGKLGWPEGVLDETATSPPEALKHFEFNRQDTTTSTNGFPHVGAMSAPHHPIGYWSSKPTVIHDPDISHTLSYSTYRNLEEGLRRAFANKRAGISFYNKNT